MARFNIQYLDGPSLDIEAADQEAAWADYKRQTGLRRLVTETAPPKILEIPHALAGAPVATPVAPAAPVSPEAPPAAGPGRDAEAAAGPATIAAEPAHVDDVR